MPNDRRGSRPLAFAACLVGVGSLFGCTTLPLAGTNDVALEYEVEREATETGSFDVRVLAASVKARLAAAHAIADVTAAGDAVRVVIDADAAAAVDELLSWRGGLSAYRVDDAYPLVPSPIVPGEASDLRPAAGNGSQARDAGWMGRAEAIARLIREARLDASHALLAERLGPDEARTRVVVLPPLVGGTAIETVTAVEHGRALALGLPAAARAVLVAERDRDPQARLAFARGRTLAATLPIEEALATPTVVLSFGDDITAYARAYRFARLLRSPVLPPLRRLSATRLPARWGLASACALLPFALSFAWLLFVRRFDRARPEPTWLVVATFGLGGLAIVPAALAEIGLASLTPWLDPSVVTLGGQLWALPLSLAVFTLVTGAVEEACKWFAAWSLASHRPEFDEPVDGIIYGCAAALGFAAVENVKYFALGRMSGAIIAVRAFMTVPAHMFFGGLWGYGMGRQLVSKRTSVFAFFALASVTHGVFDATLATEGTELVAALLVVALGLAFVALLRRTLRYGPVPRRSRRGDEDSPREDALPASALRRTYFRVGSALVFYASAAGMLGCAFALTLLGGTYELLQHRAGGAFVAAASATLALFGLAAYGASETIPLDVALDAEGITFAGSRSAWTQILGLTIEGTARRSFVRLILRDRVVRLGPAPVATARILAAAIESGGRRPT